MSRFYIMLISVMNFFIVISGMLFSGWLQTTLGAGASLWEVYQPWSLAVAGILLLSSFIGTIVASHVPVFQQSLASNQQFRALMVSTFIACIGVFILLPHISWLQLICFVFSVVIFGIVLIVFPKRLRTTAYTQITLDSLRESVDHRHLLQVWLKYRIAERYRQTVLGILWIVLLPLLQSAVLAFVFIQLRGARNLGDTPFVAFILSGSIIYGIFRSVLQSSAVSINSSIPLFKEVYFPREIVIFLLTGEVLIDFIFTFLAMVVINLVLFNLPPNIYYVFIPIPVLIMVGLTVGLAFVVSWGSMIIRDIQQLISVALQLLFFLTVLYSPYLNTGPSVAKIMALNPLSSIVNAFRDIVLYARVPNWTTLVYPGMLAIIFLYLGYVIFKVNEDKFVEYG